MVGGRAKIVGETPDALGFAMPAEWAPHAATWIGWPHNRGDWPGKMAPVYWAYGEIVRRLTQTERVCILVDSKAHADRARGVLSRAGVDFLQVTFFERPTNRGWTRDFGPVFVRGEGARAEVAVVDFQFNAWAKYPDWELDDGVAKAVARKLELRLFPAVVNGRRFVLEGGAVDGNGQGALLTTEECLLDPKVQVRNPGMSRAEVEAALRMFLGAKQVIWLGKGIAGDDTHGHVDDVCRFVNAHTAVLCRETHAADANYRVLEENRERLSDVRLLDGSRLTVVYLPMPAPLMFRGQRLPASYANFYIANGAVLVPTFNDPNDRIALGMLAELFHDRTVVGIHAVDLIWGLGAIHCLTHEQPA